MRGEFEGAWPADRSHWAATSAEFTGENFAILRLLASAEADLADAGAAAGARDGVRDQLVGPSPRIAKAAGFSLVMPNLSNSLS